MYKTLDDLKIYIPIISIYRGCYLQNSASMTLYNMRLAIDDQTIEKGLMKY